MQSTYILTQVILVLENSSFHLENTYNKEDYWCLFEK